MNRHEKISHGLCAVCGKQPNLTGIKECEKCRDKRRNAQKKQYHQTQYNKNKEKISSQRKIYKQAGLCSRCGKEKENSNLTCSICLQKQTEKRQHNKDIVFAAYGGYKCSCCGENIKEFLQIDHINNDGAKHRKSIFGEKNKNKPLYSWIIKNNFPPMFQILCANCNWGKRMNNGVCPHEKLNGETN